MNVSENQEGVHVEKNIRAKMRTENKLNECVYRIK